MGESTCLMQQPFSYVSGFPNEAKEGNPIHALGQSVSFGRFVSDSLAWEKWSTFSHNKYVEEAERYSRPGSVAQKKAFFEAHYKKIAAQKAAAALLEQASTTTTTDASSKTGPDESQTEAEVNNIIIPTKDSKQDVLVDKSEVEATDAVKTQNILVEKNMNVESPNQNVKDMELKGATEMEKCVKETKMDKPQLKSSMSKKKLDLSSSKSSNYSRASKQPSSPAKPTVLSQLKKDTMATPMKKKSVVDLPDKKRATPKSIHKSIYLTPAREINRLASSIIRKIDGSRVGSNSKPSKDISTPLRTPTKASMSGIAKHPLTTPLSENKRTETPLGSSTIGNKTVRARWHFLPTEYEKLEEKFNASQTQNAQQQATLKEKAETELRKLRQSLCFKARPLPDFYKERATTPVKQTKKVPLTQPQSPKLGRTPTLSAVHRFHSNPPQKPSMKNIGYNHALEKNMHNSTYSPHFKIFENYS
ncbi:hypothetical protein EZV62_020034 [Acer yangbiense]|uniref:TPX2 C-terminal domain-containing protein n=1 Tax=Acer yangbiense TaxID=1000413 RepID=A0A5C7HD84_9ROSI|nr:hypothetical protein EZV62_020034 [Acer yangbiense]